MRYANGYLGVVILRYRLEEQAKEINRLREALEETAHRVTVDALVGIYQWTRPSGDITYLRFAFAAQANGFEEGRALDAGIIRAVWLAPEELAAQPERWRSPLVMQVIEDYLAGRRFPLDVIRHYG